MMGKERLNSLMTGGPYHIETSLLICKANQWTGFYMTTTSVVKELKQIFLITFH